jgi:hypothetical protein
MKKTAILFISFLLLSSGFFLTSPLMAQTKKSSSKSASGRKAIAKSTKKKHSQTNLPIDAKSLTEQEKVACIELLEFLDGADAVFSITKDPYQFNERVLQMNPLVENLGKKVHAGIVRATIGEVAVAYYDIGALLILRHERETRENWKLLPENANYLGAIRRRHFKLLADGNDDVLDAENISNIYTYAKVWKTALFKALNNEL